MTIYRKLILGLCMGLCVLGGIPLSQAWGDPSPIPLVVEGKNDKGFSSPSGALPASFDLRLIQGVSPVKNQGKFDTCWAFAALGSLESSFQGLSRSPRNFSELHLAYYTYGDTAQGHASFTKPRKESNVLDQRGNDQRAVAVLARWRGPLEESAAPYPAPPLYVVFDPPQGTPQVHLQQAWGVPWSAAKPQYARALKELIRLFGGCTAHLYMPFKGHQTWLKEETGGYCYSGEQRSNHGVLLVGWDDTYSRNNFLSPPRGDGAWIAKNSWGTDFGKEGFFYISYYDTSVWSGFTYQGEGGDNYGSIYQHDPLGCTARMGFESPEAEFANVFKARKDETITAVSFYTPVENSSFEIRGWHHVRGAPSTGKATPVLARGTLKYGGYHTVSLQKEWAITSGDSFALGVTLKTPGNTTPIPLEQPLEGYSDQARANPGESYVRKDKDHPWEDLAVVYHKGSNVCLKAFSRNDRKTPAPSRTSQTGGGCKVGPLSSTSLLLLLGSAPFMVLGRRFSK